MQRLVTLLGAGAGMTDQPNIAFVKIIGTALGPAVGAAIGWLPGGVDSTIGPALKTLLVAVGGVPPSR